MVSVSIVPWFGPAAVIFSPFAGSFICCVIDRAPKGIDFVCSRSRCDYCGGTLAARDLVPIFSYLALGGRCRVCHKQLATHLMFAEIGILILTAAAVWFAPPDETLLAIVFAWLLLGLAQYDLVHGRLPDSLTVTLCVLGICCSALYRTPNTVLASILGASVGVLIPLCLARCYEFFTKRNGLGGGDIKLFGAAGAWVGWQGLSMLLLTASLSALLALLFTGSRSRLARISFGPFITFSTLAVWCWQLALQGASQ